LSTHEFARRVGAVHLESIRPVGHRNQRHVVQQCGGRDHLVVEGASGFPPAGMLERCSDRGRVPQERKPLEEVVKAVNPAPLMPARNDSG